MNNLTKNRNLFSDERGQILVLFAFAFPILLGFVGLVVDVGMIYLEKERLQNKVDAAALGGAQEILRNPHHVASIVRVLAEKNNLDPERVQITNSPEENSVKIDYSQEVTLFFYPFSGMNQ